MTREEAVIHNLVCFNLNFSKFAGMTDIVYQAPSYILEKFNKWIVGEEPRKYWEFLPKYRKFEFKQVDTNEVLSTLKDSDVFTFMEYKRIWKGESEKVLNILLYLMLTHNMNLFNCTNQFERLIGKIEDINDKESGGLHELVMRDIYPIVMLRNKYAIEMISGDLKLKKLIN